MGRLQTWGAAARRSRPCSGSWPPWWSSPWSPVASCWPPAVPAPSGTSRRRTSTRAVALGRLGPLRARAGQPLPDAPGRASRPPPCPRAPRRRPTRAWSPADLGLTMTVRPTNCHADRRPARHQRGRGRRRRQHRPATASARSRPSRPATWATRSRRPTWPSTRPAWSCCRTGPTTSTSHAAWSTSWPSALGRRASASGRVASPTGPSRPSWQPTCPTSAPAWPRPLRQWRRTPAPSPCSTTTSPFPSPSQIADDTAASGLHTNLVCTGLKTNAAATYAAAQVVLSALNQAVAGAVADARAHHVTNVTLVDIAGRLRRARDLHGRTLGVLR